MEGRKLQLTGGSTYVVSLPKRWVLDAGLKAGDTVFLETEGDGAVSVRPRPADKVPMRRRLFEEKGEERRDHLLRKLIGAYIGGFSFIEIRFPSEMAPFVRKVARESNLDEAESPDVCADQFPQQVVSTLLPFLLKQSASHRHLVGGPRADRDSAVSFRLQKDRVPGLEARVPNPPLGQGHDVGRTSGQLKFSSFHSPHSYHYEDAIESKGLLP